MALVELKENDSDIILEIEYNIKNLRVVTVVLISNEDV
jgi:hypothetical protein